MSAALSRKLDDWLSRYLDEKYKQFPLRCPCALLVTHHVFNWKEGNIIECAEGPNMCEMCSADEIRVPIRKIVNQLATWTAKYIDDMKSFTDTCGEHDGHDPQEEWNPFEDNLEFEDWSPWARMWLLIREGMPASFVSLYERIDKFFRQTATPETAADFIYSLTAIWLMARWYQLSPRAVMQAILIWGPPGSHSSHSHTAVVAEQIDEEEEKAESESESPKKKTKRPHPEALVVVKSSE